MTIEQLLIEYRELANELDVLFDKVNCSMSTMDQYIALKIIQNSNTLDETQIELLNNKFKLMSQNEDFGLNDLIRNMIPFAQKELRVYKRLLKLSMEDQIRFWKEIYTTKFTNQFNHSISTMLKYAQQKDVKQSKSLDIPNENLEYPKIDYDDPSIT